MSVAATLSSEEGSLTYPILGSWTAFNKKMCDVAVCKSETGSLPVIPHPKDNICKYYLDFLLDMKNDPNVNYIFCRI